MNIKIKAIVLCLSCAVFGISATGAASANDSSSPDTTVHPVVLPKPPALPDIPGTPIVKGSYPHSINKDKHKKTRIIVTTIPRRVNVLLNGVLIGQTPLDTFVNSGNNVVMTLSKTGFSPVRLSVALRAGETLPLTLKLEKQDVWRPYVP